MIDKALSHNLPAIAIVLKFSLIQLHSQIRSLKIQSDHLAACVPENLLCRRKEN